MARTITKGRLIGWSLVALAMIGGAMVVRSARVASESELNLHAILCVAPVIETYVAQTGAWPRSWDDLEPIIPARADGSAYRKSEHWDLIRPRVIVKFDADRAMLANPRASDLIRANGPTYSFDWRIDYLYALLEQKFCNPHKNNPATDRATLP